MLQYGQKTHVEGTLQDGLAQMHAIPVATVQHVPHGKAATIPGSTHGLVETIGSGNSNPIGQLRDAVEAVHLQERDIGVLAAAVELTACTFASPAPPPPSPKSPPPPPPVEESSDSGLSTGEIAGVAVSATVGGIVLLVVVGLVFRSLLFKSVKPVFTCLEKAHAEKQAPTPA